MRVLMVTQQDHTDPREGGTLRTRAVEAALREHGAEVDVVAWMTAVPRRGFRIRPWEVVVATLRVTREAVRIGAWVCLRRVSWSLVREIVGLRRLHCYDLVLVEYSTMAMYRPLLDAPAVIDLHNVESRLLGQIARSRGRAGLGGMLRKVQEAWDAGRLDRLERGLGRYADHVSVVSVADAAVLTELTAGAPLQEVVVAPNGFHAIDPGTAPARREEAVAFVATLGWQPNIDAASWLALEVWPRVVVERPSARLQLVGRSPARSVLELASDSISIHPDVPDVTSYVSRAAVATAPLRASGGTRLKILEALGAGTPVVATAAGALGLEHLRGDGLRITDDPAEFARALVEQLDSRDSLDRDAVRRNVEDYAWPTVLHPLTELCIRAGSPSLEPDAP